MLQNLVRMGRGYKISVGVGSQKPKGVNGWFVDNSAHVYIFGMKQAEVTRYVRNTGAAWVEQVMPQIPIGSFRFAYENWQGRVTIFDPVQEYPWGEVE